MTSTIQVWVTGVSGDLGQAVVKALRLSHRKFLIHGSDVNDEGAGIAFVDAFHILPKADDSGYIDCLNFYCEYHDISVVIPASEPEIYSLSKLGSVPQLPCGTKILCQPNSWIETYGDKLRCMQELLGHIDIAPFADGYDQDKTQELISSVGFPLILKERKSSGSKGVLKVSNSKDLDQALRNMSSPLVQGYIDDSFGEYSVGVFATKDLIRCFSFKRRLGPGGCSWFAEFSDDADVLEYALKIARFTNVRGAVNIQVRKSSLGVKLLEINPRISSLIAARAVSGFRDLEWCLDLILGYSSYEKPPKIRPVRYQRIITELVDFGTGFGRIAQWDNPTVIDV